MEDSTAAFEEFAHTEPKWQTSRRGPLARWTLAGLQGISSGALWVALLTAIFIVSFHTYLMCGGNPPPFSLALKSAIPLIGIGLSYICLMLTIQRTIMQRLLGFLVGLAFVLWGAEQFMGEPEWISFIDDIVVLLFVIDLSIVIRGNLAQSSMERRLRNAGFPAIKTVKSEHGRGAGESID